MARVTRAASHLSVEEVKWRLKYDLGHVTMKGLPAIQTTVRYIQLSRAQVKDKLKLLKG